MTPHVLEQLPLWVEGDLAAPDQAAVERHLAQCPACSTAAGELRASQRLLREALASPFAEVDALGLRLRVMDRIRAEVPAGPARPLGHRPALLAACAASLLVGVLLWRQGSSPTSHPALPLAPELPAAEEPTARPHPPTAGAAPDLPATRAVRARSVPRQGAESPPLGEPARIEFQTADPSIRIIWLAQARPFPDPTASPQEEP